LDDLDKIDFIAVKLLMRDLGMITFEDIDEEDKEI